MSFDRDKFQPVGRKTDRSWPEKGKELQPGDFIEGVYVDKDEHVGEHDSKVYVLKMEDGTRVGVWGCTVLDTKFEKLAFGQRVAVEYKGIPSGKKYKDFFVGVDPSYVPEIQINADVPF